VIITWYSLEELNPVPTVLLLMDQLRRLREGQGANF
jgi:hypothetical protein